MLLIGVRLPFAAILKPSRKTTVPNNVRASIPASHSIHVDKGKNVIGVLSTSVLELKTVLFSQDILRKCLNKLIQ